MLQIKKEDNFNYLFFSFFFLSLFSIHAYSLYVLETLTFFPYCINVFLQCAFETTFLITLNLIFQRYFPKFLLNIFISALSLLLLAHHVDFIMIRLMGITVWYLMYLMSFEIGGNFIEMIKASNIPFFAWIFGSFAVSVIFFISIYLFNFLLKISNKRKIQLSFKLLSPSLVILLFTTFMIEKRNLNDLSYLSYVEFKQILPLKKTFYQKNKRLIDLQTSIKDSFAKTNYQALDIKKEKLPNVFLFVIESLREDFIKEEIAPNITKFKENELSFQLASSGANASHVSWFTIFHSELPIKFSKERVDAKINTGSRAIDHLKEIGYKIHLYTSAELAFYNMGESIFGENYRHLETKKEFPHVGNITPAESDKKAITTLLRDLKDYPEEGQVFIVFLDATHFGYSWLEDTGAKFTPVDDKIDYISAAFSKSSLEKIKNRYKNSIYFVDHLIGNVLNSKHLNKDAVIVITGDHGEEFYDKGKLFHASHLSEAQTHVPLYYKFGDETNQMKEKASKISSHLDIFPTIIDYVSGTSSNSFPLDGQSIFSTSKRPFNISARYNGGKEPFEFLLEGVEGKILISKDKRKECKIELIEGDLPLENTLQAFEAALNISK